MEPYELMTELLEYPSIWDGDAHLYIDGDRTPRLSGWYEKTDESIRVHVEFTYKNGKWDKEGI